jgi:hypothetical protein
MKTSLYKLSVLAAIGCALTLAPVRGSAQEKKTEKPAEKSGGAQGETNKAPNPNRTVPFRGKVDAVDKQAKTVTVGTRVFHVTAETRIQKDGKAATLADFVVGEPIRGSLRQTEDGKLNAVSLSLGQKPADGEKSAAESPKPAKPQSKEAPKPDQKAEP